MYTVQVEKRSSSASYKLASTNQNESNQPTADQSDFSNVGIIYGIGAKVPARLVLYFLSWSGFLVSFMMRNDMNFAIVAMVRAETDNVRTIIEYQNTTIITDFVNTSTSTPIPIMISDLNNTTVPIVNTINTREITYDQYDWSSAVKSIIISSFYWCYVLSQVVGGIATQYFGTKQVFGWSQFVTAFCSLCIPVSANLHYVVVIILRSIQGFASGLTWPAMYAIVGYWIPKHERSRFMSSFQGFSIGIGLTYPICGFIIQNFGWHYVFYTTGTLGMIWCILWYFLAFNTPNEHPRISPLELNYIEVNVSAEVNESHGMKVPWRSIFTSKPAWAIGITTFGRIWIHYIFIVSGPTFMKSMLKFEYETNGFLSGLPFICSYISSVLFCFIADKLVLNGYVSLTNVRKLFTAMSQIIPGILIYWIGYIEENIILLLIVWFIAVSFITASYAGAMASIVDIAPNLAGSVLAFCQTIHMSASFLSPLVTGLIIVNESSVDQWRTVFGISSAITILTYMFFQIYGTSDIQKWNYPIPQNEISSEERQILKVQNDDFHISKEK